MCARVCNVYHTFHYQLPGLTEPPAGNTLLGLLRGHAILVSMKKIHRQVVDVHLPCRIGAGCDPLVCCL